LTDKVLENADIRKQIRFCVTFDGKHSNYISFNDLLSDGLGKRLEKVPHFPIDLKNDICLIGYTSGTTGVPKGAIWTHYAILGALITPIEFNQNQHKSNILGCHYPFTHITGTWLLPQHLFAGFAIVIIDFNKYEDIFDAIAKYKASLKIIYFLKYWKIFNSIIQ